MRPNNALPPHMQNSLFALSLGFAVLIAMAQNAFGQTTPVAPQSNPQCGPREAVLIALAERYGEGRRAIGIAGQDYVMEIFSNSLTGTWTITATKANGMMCLIASGGSLEWVSEPAPANGRPA